MQACREQIACFQALGARVVEISIPGLEAARVAHLISIAGEMAASMGPYYAEHRTDFGLDVRVNLAIAHEFTTRDYVNAQRVRTQVLASMSDAFSSCDVIITPASARTAPPLRPDALPDGESDLTTVLDLIRFATLANLTGLPAIAYPIAYDGDGLPISCQLMGSPWSESLLLRLSRIGARTLSRLKPRMHFDLLA